MGLRQEIVEYRDGEAELSRLLVLDERDVARPGVLVVHGGAGLDDHAKGRAKQLAELGPGDIRTRILVCHGALDPHVPMTQVTEFIDEMGRAGGDWQLIVYGGAMHGFTHDFGPESPGVAYHASSDARSLSAIQAFLAEAFEAEG